jgi:TPR repeat protein
MRFVSFAIVSLFVPVIGFASVLKEELSVIQSKALEGDPYYQGTLSLFYKYGEKGLSIDLSESERWAKLSAEKDGGIGLAVLASIELERGKTERGQFLYDEAYLHSNLRELAKAKDPIALFCIGLMEMDNPPRNLEKGIRNLERAGDQGLATAQATLGMIYFTGIGVPRDPQQAVKWCSQASRQKIPLGMFYLGMAYSTGDGLRKNDDYSIRWIANAAERGLMMAQLTLGMKLALGDGVERKLELGVQWLRQAANQGSAEAQLQLRRFENLLVRSPSRNMTIDSMQKQSIAKLAEKITLPSENKTLKSETLSIANDSKKIISKPLTSETSESTKLGLEQYKQQNYKAAQKHFLEASEKKDPVAIRYLGIMNFLGQGYEVNYPKAIDLLSQAKSLGDEESNRYLKIAKTFSQ